MINLSMNQKIWAILLIVIAACGLYFILKKTHNGSGKNLTPTVTVKTMEPQKVFLWSEFSGRLQAVDSAEIRPEVSGRITEVRFEDGDKVDEGDILFVIDPRLYEAAVARAESRLETATANADFAKVELTRGENMIKTQAIAQRIFDERDNTNKTSLAAIKSAEADLKQANLDLEHAYVRSPLTGRAGRVELTVGNLVQAGPNAPLLTRIVVNDPIYADFEVDEQSYIQNVRNVANNRSQERHLQVELTLPGDNEHIYRGQIYSFDNRLDVTSGTIRARAKFNNPDGILVPGMFVKVRLAGSKESDVILVPQQAISSDQNKKYVYVVTADNKVAYREVELGREVDAQRIVLKGLAPGDRVIVKGIQHVKPNDTVIPEEMISKTES